MEKVLLVEDSRTFAAVLKKTIEHEFQFSVDWAASYAEAERLLAEPPAQQYFVGLLDLHLPDAMQGEILDLVIAHQIPPIALTGKFGDEIREYIWARKVVDYVLKDSPQSINYIITMVRRLYRNRSIKIMVVEDSSFSRKHLTRLLQVHQYQVFEGKGGDHALTILFEHPDIKLAIIDYQMPDMDGIELTRKIRETFPKDTLAIIGISALGNNVMSAQFIKNGANDFITKPFVNEEFYCRLTQNIEMIEFMERVKDASHKDYLTELYNRRYFFESGQLLYANAVRRNFSLIVAMLDIDHFKRVNDTYGHKAGDIVLQQVAAILKKRFRKSDIVARFGGEEFCILATNMEQGPSEKIFEDLRTTIAQTDIPVETANLHVTVSIGVCTCLQPSLEDMIQEADALLYRAKAQGRNQVLYSPSESQTSQVSENL
jgi:diguanylate cyclase (GGDEF)-like protein